MPYQIEQINNLEQFGELITTFLLVDTDGLMPDIRLDRSFKVSDSIERIIENQKKIDCLFYENEYLRKIEINE